MYTEQDSESWKPVFGLTGYEVSDLGRVRSIDRCVVYNTGKVVKYAGQMLSLTLGATGYYQITVSRKRYSVHTLVLEAFVGPRPDKMVCRHLNGDSTDNRLTNIVWGTQKENMKDKIAHGRLVNQNTKKKVCPNGHPLEGDNLDLSQKKLGWRQCKQCHVKYQKEHHQTRRAARKLLGLSRKEYESKYGYSIVVARQIIATHNIKQFTQSTSS